MGRPGSGKDTQAELLAKKFGLIHIISSKLIEKVLKSREKRVKLEGKIYNLEKERAYAQDGALLILLILSRRLLSTKLSRKLLAGKGVDNERFA